MCGKWLIVSETLACSSTQLYRCNDVRVSGQYLRESGGCWSTEREVGKLLVGRGEIVIGYGCSGGYGGHGGGASCITAEVVVPSS